MNQKRSNKSILVTGVTDSVGGRLVPRLLEAGYHVRLRQGDAVDFWRVEMVEPDHLIRLRAEMKLPGQGWLQFEVGDRVDGRTDLVQTAYFASKGLSGLLY